MRLSKYQLRALPPKTKLWWKSAEGMSNKTILMKRDGEAVYLRAAFSANAIRWSLRTNKPMWQSRGYVGDVWLELRESD